MGWLSDTWKSVTSNPVVGGVVGSILGGPVGGFIGGGGLDYFSGSGDRAAQEQARADALRMREQDIGLQREFAQNGIRWRVEDAVAAGLHPLAALGAGGVSYQPVGVGDMGYGARDSATDRIWDMGQFLGRAALAAATRPERNEAMDKLALERAGLQNDLLRAQINNINQSLGPPLPSNSDMPLLTGQGNAYATPQGGSQAYVQEMPLQRVHSAPGSPGQEVGAVTDFGYARTASGGLAVVPSQDVKNRIEDQIVPETAWSIRNHLLRSITPSRFPAPDPKQFPLPKGYTRWRWNWARQEYEPSRAPSSESDSFFKRNSLRDYNNHWED